MKEPSCYNCDVRPICFMLLKILGCIILLTKSATFSDALNQDAALLYVARFRVIQLFKAACETNGYFNACKAWRLICGREKVDSEKGCLVSWFHENQYRV
jgi:hypothetical protein